MKSRSLARLRISSRERILFAKRLSLYLRSGIPITEALDLIYISGVSKSQQRLVRKLLQNVQEGTSLSRALSSFPRVYTPSHLQLIAVGEASGTLAASLSSLAFSLDERARRIRSILGTLTYPAILFIGAMGVSAFLLFFAFPKIVPIFRGLHAQLPFTTRVLLGISTLLQKHWRDLFVGILVVLISVASAFRSPQVRRLIDLLLLKLPLVGKLLKSVAFVSAFRMMATLLGSGIRLDESIRLAATGIANSAYQEALQEVREAVLAGSKLSVALSCEPALFSPVAVQLVSVGEMTGTLVQSIESTAIILEEEFADQLRLFASLLEPVIMLVMGLVIGFIALAIISPMYGITQNLTP